MSALDACEPQIIRAFEKDGWRILRKPFGIRTGNRLVAADLNLERGANGTTEQLIVVEVKCFTNAELDLPEL